MKKVGLYCFHRDLRLEDNVLLRQACIDTDTMAFAYINEPQGQFARHFSPHCKQGEHQAEFEQQCVQSIKQQLGAMGHVLHCYHGNISETLSEILELNSQITDIYISSCVDWDLKNITSYIGRKNHTISVHEQENQSLFSRSQLPFDIEQLPISFSAFRRAVECIEIQTPADLVTLDKITPFVLKDDGCQVYSTTGLGQLNIELVSSTILDKDDQSHRQYIDNTGQIYNKRDFYGGSIAGKNHLDLYFKSRRASSYKETRNHLDDWTASTAFSPWLAWGCITPKQIIETLNCYESAHGTNESTYWIKFELMWRDYFRWYAIKHGVNLFRFAGIHNKRPLKTFYAQHYRAWCEGNTGYPIVDACMRQLNQTGIMSNRGRQLAASCFIHELGLDWRYGAAYFEARLIDYNVCSNWGNWQYLAGVGADPRGHRKFDLEKQTQWYDPQREFIERWLRK